MDNGSPGKIVVLIIAATFFMENIDSSILNIAVPTIANSLHVHPLHLKLAITVYLLSLGIFIPVSGWIADRFGTKRVYAIAVAVFAFSSLSAGLSLNLPMLVISRFIQGVGGAMMVPVGRLILLYECSEENFLKAMVWIIVPALMGPVLGPVIGGLILSVANWRWVFFVNLPIAAAAFCFILKYINNFKKEDIHPFDWWGFTFLGCGVAALSFGFSALGQHTGGVINDILLALAGIVLIFSYIVYQRRKAHPVINREIFENRNFTIGLSLGFFMRLGINSTPFILSLLMQIGFGFTPLKTSGYLVWIFVGMIFIKPLSRVILNYFRLKHVLIVNGLFVSGFILSFAWFNASTPFWLVAIVFVAFGLFLSMQFTCFGTVNFSGIKEGLKSQVSSFASGSQQIANSFAVALAALLLSFFSGDLIHYKGISLEAFHHTFIISAIIVFIGSLGFMLIGKETGLTMTAYKKHKRVKRTRPRKF